MPHLLKVRQSQQLARALICEARAARLPSLLTRLKATWARWRVDDGVEIDVVVRSDQD